MYKKFNCYRAGLKISGHIHKKKSGRLPAVILCHGFMANELTCYAYAKVLAGLGYAAFTFDFCGGGITSRSDGKTENMSVATELRDLEAVYEYVKNSKYVDPSHISVLGCSQGGLVSAIFAAKCREIKNLILFYPALCIPDDAKRGEMLGFKFDTSNIPDPVSKFPMRIGKCYVEAVINMDYKSAISGYDGNTILIHGTADNIVNISYARSAKDLYSTCHYHEIEGGGHMFFGKHQIEAIRILKQEMAI